MLPLPGVTHDPALPNLLGLRIRDEAANDPPDPLEWLKIAS